jgi:hypothetical protein
MDVLITGGFFSFFTDRRSVPEYPGNQSPPVTPQEFPPGVCPRREVIDRASTSSLAAADRSPVKPMISALWSIPSSRNSNTPVAFYS